MSRSPGTVYLIHLEVPFRHASHYIGWTPGDVDERLAKHRAGAGSRMLAAVAAAGIGFDVVRTWAGDRLEEKRLKGMRMAPRLCPACRSNPARERRAPGAGPWPVGAGGDR